MEDEAALKNQLTEINKKIDAIEEKYFALGEMNKETFEKFNSRYQEEKRNIEANLQKCPVSISNLSGFIQQAVTFSSELNTVWDSGNISCRQNLQKLVFPQGIYYERQNHSFRTEKTNFIFSLIEANSGTSEENKKRTNYLLNSLSPLAESEGFEPSIPFRGIHTFQACSFNHSDNSPIFSNGKNNSLVISHRTIFLHLQLL